MGKIADGCPVVWLRLVDVLCQDVFFVYVSEFISFFVLIGGVAPTGLAMETCDEDPGVTNRGAGLPFG